MAALAANTRLPRPGGVIGPHGPGITTQITAAGAALHVVKNAALNGAGSIDAAVGRKGGAGCNLMTEIPGAMAMSTAATAASGGRMGKHQSAVRMAGKAKNPAGSAATGRAASDPTLSLDIHWSLRKRDSNSARWACYTSRLEAHTMVAT